MALFNEIKDSYIERLKMYVPIVARVHGEHHPEIYELRRIFEGLEKKIREAAQEIPDLQEDFSRLREITGGYRVPEDVCETYEAVYKMLEELDKAYSN